MSFIKKIVINWIAFDKSFQPRGVFLLCTQLICLFLGYYGAQVNVERKQKEQLAEYKKQLIQKNIDLENVQVESSTLAMSLKNNQIVLKEYLERINTLTKELSFYHNVMSLTEDNNEIELYDLNIQLDNENHLYFHGVIVQRNIKKEKIEGELLFEFLEQAEESQNMPRTSSLVCVQNVLSVDFKYFQQFYGHFALESTHKVDEVIIKIRMKKNKKIEEKELKHIYLQDIVHDVVYNNTLKMYND